MTERSCTRRDCLRTVAAASAAAALPQGLAGAREPDARRTPNIVYILADDLGYGDLGCYGQQKIKTPVLDGLAARGLRFTDHYAGSTVCAPSRCVLMTGLHTGHARIRGNGRLPLRPSPEDRTVAEYLKQAGYATACIGKWGLGEADQTGDPQKKGFDHFFGYYNQGAAHSYYPDHLWRNGERVPLPGNAGDKREQYSHDLMTAEALGWLDRTAGRPFFLYLPYTIPHAEVLVPEDSMEPYRGQFPETPFPGGHYGAQPTPNAARAGMISRMDRDIGRIMERLARLGVADNTLVMFSSDNGPCPAGGQDWQFFDATGGLRGIKRTLYEGGIRVPMIAHWPGVIRPGRVSDHPSAFWDVLATCCDVAGVEQPGRLDGLSFAAELRGGKQPTHQHLYWEHKGWQAARMGQIKAVRPAPDKPVEIYDLQADRAEQHDLAADRPELVARAKQLFAASHVDDPRWPLA